MKGKLHLICLLIVSLILSSACWAQTAPKIDKTLTVAGLKEAVTVRRDERSIPYIEAKNEADLYFAQGFVTAQDRLWQMDLYRRVARGETAEIFGRQILDEDKRWRRFGFAAVAEDNVRSATPENRAALDAYALGVNAYIASLDEKSFPVEFQVLQYRPRPWTPADSLVVSKIFDDALSNTWRMDLMKAGLMDLPKEKLERVLNPSSPLDVLLVGKDDLTAETQRRGGKSKQDEQDGQDKNFNSPDSAYSQQKNPQRPGVSAVKITAEIEETRKNSLERIGFYAEDLAASNNWVISGKRTADGKPILANDPHLRPTQPPIWYMVHLSLPGERFAGVTTAGIPGIIIGHNEHIAWGFTNVGPDVQDLYLETFDKSGKYKTPNGFIAPVVRREQIKVRKNPFSTETETEILEVKTTRNGVIVFEDGAKRYALRWTAFDAKNDTLRALSMLTKARNWQDFQAALRNYAGAMQNFVYADREGNIGWIAAGRVPIRKTGDGSLPYDGATDAGDWTGFIPFEELPMLYNPPEGFIMTANQRTVGKSYKYHDLIARAHTVARAPRLQNLLAANRKVSVKDVSDYQFDTFSVINSRFAREVANLKGASDETLKLLAAWDGRMNADSRAALVADAMRSEFRNRILIGNFGAERARNLALPFDTAFFDWVITTKPKEWLPKEFASYQELLRACEKNAFASLRAEAQKRKFTADEANWNWGTFQKTNFSHPLAIAPLVGGQFAIEPLAQNGSGGAGASPNVGAAVSMRFIATPADWDSTRQTLPTGESGDPKSIHYKDQLEAWRSGNTPVFPFTKSAVEKAARETILLTAK